MFYKNLYQKIVQVVKDLVSHEYLYFDKPIHGGLEHFTLYSIWAVCVSPDGKIFVMDDEERWHSVDEQDIIVPDLLNKVEKEQQKYIVNSN